MRETGEPIRDLASSVTKSTELGPSPGATDLLVHQHRLVEGLFERLESSKKGFDETLGELADDSHGAHLDRGASVLSGGAQGHPDSILEGLEEHAMGRFALRRLLGTRTSDKELKARLEALKELMTNHHHEEEHDLFPAVRRLMSDVALDEARREDAGALRGQFETRSRGRSGDVRRRAEKARAGQDVRARRQSRAFTTVPALNSPRCAPAPQSRTRPRPYREL